MTDKNNQTGGVNPIIAAMAGAVAAGAVVAGAYALSNKDNQAKIKKVAGNIKSDIINKKDVVVDKAQKLEGIAKNAVKDVKNI